PVEFDARDLALDALASVGLGPFAQIAAIERRTDMIGTVPPLIGQMRALALHPGDPCEAITAIGLLVPALARVEPEMLETRRPVIFARQAEAVEIAVAVVLPVIEQYAELEGRLRRAHEFGLGDAEDAVEIDERRDRRFAHADRA